MIFNGKEHCQRIAFRGGCIYIIEEKFALSYVAINQDFILYEIILQLFADARILKTTLVFDPINNPMLAGIIMKYSMLSIRNYNFVQCFNDETATNSYNTSKTSLLLQEIVSFIRRKIVR